MSRPYRRPCYSQIQFENSRQSLRQQDGRASVSPLRRWHLYLRYSLKLKASGLFSFHGMFDGTVGAAHRAARLVCVKTARLTNTVITLICIYASQDGRLYRTNRGRQRLAHRARDGRCPAPTGRLVIRKFNPAFSDNRHANRTGWPVSRPYGTSSYS